MNAFEQMIDERIVKYARLPENQNADGTVNWNYVDADICMELNMTTECLNDYYLPYFDKAVDRYLNTMDALKGVCTAV